MNPTSEISWHKSTRSSNGGAQCVEVGAWRTSSRSGDGHGRNCAEAGTCNSLGIAVRDSKFIDGGVLTAGVAEWTSLLACVGSGAFER